MYFHFFALARETGDRDICDPEKLSGDTMLNHKLLTKSIPGLYLVLTYTLDTF